MWELNIDCRLEYLTYNPFAVQFPYHTYHHTFQNDHTIIFYFYFFFLNYYYHLLCKQFIKKNFFLKKLLTWRTQPQPPSPPLQQKNITPPPSFYFTVKNGRNSTVFISSFMSTAFIFIRLLDIYHKYRTRKYFRLTVLLTDIYNTIYVMSTQTLLFVSHLVFAFSKKKNLLPTWFLLEIYFFKNIFFLVRWLT